MSTLFHKELSDIIVALIQGRLKSKNSPCIGLTKLRDHYLERLEFANWYDHLYILNSIIEENPILKRTISDYHYFIYTSNDEVVCMISTDNNVVIIPEGMYKEFSEDYYNDTSDLS